MGKPPVALLVDTGTRGVRVTVLSASAEDKLCPRKPAVCADKGEEKRRQKVPESQTLLQQASITGRDPLYLPAPFMVLPWPSPTTKLGMLTMCGGDGRLWKMPWMLREEWGFKV